MSRLTVLENAEQADGWARVAQKHIQSIQPLLPCYAPQGWWREVDTLLGLARKLIASSAREHQVWLNARKEASE